MNAVRDLASLVFFFLFISVIVLVTVGVLYLVWRGLIRPPMSYLVEKGILQPIVSGPRTTREHSSSGRWPHFIGIGILSAVLEVPLQAITHMNTPGQWVVGWLCVKANQQGAPYDFQTIIVVPIVVDGAMIFFVLWGAYSMWMGIRDQEQ